MVKKVQTPHLKKKKTLQFCHFYARVTLEKLYNSAFLHIIDPCPCIMWHSEQN